MPLDRSARDSAVSWRKGRRDTEDLLEVSAKRLYSLVLTQGSLGRFGDCEKADVVFQVFLQNEEEFQYK